MKKTLLILCTLIILGGTLIGCTPNDNSSKPNSVTDNAPYTIGIIQPMDHPSLNLIRETIVEELDALGLSDEIQIVFQNANGDASLLPSIMQNLLNSDVDILVPIATSTAQAAQASTNDVPIVFSAVSTPIEAGLVTSFEETTGNITGVSNSIPIEDIFKLAQELTPEVEVFGFVYNSSEVNSSAGIKRAKAYCDENGIDYREVTITGTADLHQAASSLVGSVDAFFTPNDNTIASAMPTYLQIAMDANLPTYVGADSMVADGGLATVGIDYTILGKQTAAMVARIINGESIADNPVESIAEYAKMININTAESLDLDISESLLDEFVIIGE
ncbi:putative ABC transport system substrate-binding protein [Natranaerovirga hydrolytica]|uniref:Putative ABC transport system substrate-binding protein n=1 Tax=Natranaerovirga hydrolytica TaxID=680378 RepID=A0A4R1MX08_9FIRM|nr:ABC transporter substrate-binding protein [Natranaerovirga hydrolytica]TCK97777.1 putative ABC transport system substrate-binding protein [Natranaerovirga hydrolytica]